MLAMTVQAADKVSVVPVQFAKGAQSATVKGTFKGYDSINYTLVAKAGRTMTVNISGRFLYLLSHEYGKIPTGVCPYRRGE